MRKELGISQHRGEEGRARLWKECFVLLSASLLPPRRAGEHAPGAALVGSALLGAGAAGPWGQTLQAYPG